MAHDVIYVNYYLKSRHIGKTNACPFCGKIETVSHLFISYKFASPLNKHLLTLFNRSAQTKLLLSESVFRFFQFSFPDSIRRDLLLILLSESRHVIWLCRNSVKHENKVVSPAAIIFKFDSRIKARILIDFERLAIDEFINLWCKNGFCTYDESTKLVTFSELYNH